METQVKVKGIFDIFLAAYLRTHDFKIVTTRNKDNYNLEFCFESTPELMKAIEAYFAKTDVTPALEFAENFRSLRAMLQALRFSRDGGDINGN
jgi:hypothetical protein